MMGSPVPPDGRDAAPANEQPVHKVRISNPIYLGKTEVTVGQYRYVMELKAPDAGHALPAASVKWDQAVEFCRRLSGKTGLRVRLPTEAEWEYASRAGAATRFSHGDDEGYSGLDLYAWYERNSVGRVHPVGTRTPNAWGLYDMHGNVLEWCLDWYDSQYYKASTEDDPKGPSGGHFRVRRGGSWSSPPSDVRASYRASGAPEEGQPMDGFRVCVEILGESGGAGGVRTVTLLGR
jgi:formylglycine-generating enzyme required for sulfatase activity